MPTIIQKSFKAHPSPAMASQTYPVYERRIPLKCNLVEFDDFGTFDTTNFCYVAPYAQRMEFHVNLLWDKPPHNSYVCALLFKNALPTVLGAANNEIAGTDLCIYNPANNFHISTQTTQIIDLAAGEKVWAVPCAAAASAPLKLTAAINGMVTVNYFTGKELAVL